MPRNVSMRSTLVTAFFSSLMLVSLSGVSSAQTAGTTASVPSGPAGYTHMPAVPLASVQTPSAAPLLIFPPGVTTSRGSVSVDANAGSGPGSHAPAEAADSDH